MYLKCSNNPQYDEDVKIAQRFLNSAYRCVDNNVRKSFKWSFVEEDGYFGAETAKAVTAFQKYAQLTLSEYGILDDYTMKKLKNVGPFISAVPRDKSGLLGSNCYLRSASSPIIISNSKSQKAKTIGHVFLSAHFSSWNKRITRISDVCFIVDSSMIVLSRWLETLDTVHINWRKFAYDLIYSGEYSKYSPYKKETLIWLNKGKIPAAKRGTFTAYRFSLLNKYAPVIDDARTKLNIGKGGAILGFVGLGFDVVDFSQKSFKGEVKFLDFGELTVKAASTIAESLHDWLISTSSVTQRLPISKISSNLGNTIAKTKYATKIVGVGSKVGVTAAGVGSASAIAIVGFQCVGAFLAGWEVGKWIEGKTRWGEKTGIWIWEKFLGDWVKQYYEWKINKVIMIQYPSDWTEKDINELKAKIEYILI